MDFSRGHFSLAKQLDAELDEGSEILLAAGFWRQASLAMKQATETADLDEYQELRELMSRIRHQSTQSTHWPWIDGASASFLEVLGAFERGAYESRKPEPIGRAFEILQQLRAQDGLTGKDLALKLQVDESEISRSGRRLIDGGYVLRRQRGQAKFWYITPAGEGCVDARSGAEPRIYDLETLQGTLGFPFSAATAAFVIDNRYQIFAPEVGVR